MPPRRKKPDPFAPSILVVDDDFEVRNTIHRLLAEAGYFVHEAASAREALRILEDRYIDLAVVDISMPDTDGIELLPIIRNLMPQLTILAISGFMHGAMLKVAAKLGASATLSKSRLSQEILLVVCRLLRQRG